MITLPQKQTQVSNAKSIPPRTPSSIESTEKIFVGATRWVAHLSSILALRKGASHRLARTLWTVTLWRVIERLTCIY